MPVATELYYITEEGDNQTCTVLTQHAAAAIILQPTFTTTGMQSARHTGGNRCTIHPPTPQFGALGLVDNPYKESGSFSY